MADRIIDHSEEVQRAIEEMQERVLTAIVLFIQARAKEYVPVDQGNLKLSIETKVEGERAIVGTNMDYALKMEKGGSKQPQAKDGYLTPALENHIREIEELIRQYGVLE